MRNYEEYGEAQFKSLLLRLDEKQIITVSNAKINNF